MPKSIQWKELYLADNAGSSNMHRPPLDLVDKTCPVLHNNEAIVHSLRFGMSHSSDVMDLLWHLFLCAAKFNLIASAKHVPGIHNTIAVSLSCFKCRFSDKKHRWRMCTQLSLPTCPHRTYEDHLL